MFLEHIYFFSIPASSHSVNKYDFIHINPFSNHTEVTLPIVSYSPPTILDHDARVNTNSFIDTGTLLPDAPIDSSSPWASHVPSEIVAPPSTCGYT